MSKIIVWQDKIKAVRKTTPFRKFVKELLSWTPMILYKNEDFFSRYPHSDRSSKVYSNKEYLEKFEEKLWLEYDFRLDFFANWKDLWNITPKSAMLHLYWINENSDFADAAFWTKNCYLSFVVGMDVENVLYSMFVYMNSRNVLNSVFVSNHSENIYFSLNVENGFNIFYSKFIKNSSDIWFSSNLIWCRECIFCDNLQNQDHCIRNKQYEKEEYFAMKEKILKEKNEYWKYFKEVNTKWLNIASENVSGMWILESKNIENWAIIANIENGRNVLFISGLPFWENFYDCFDAWANSNDLYWAKACWENSNNVYCSWEVGNSSNIFYSYNMGNCSYCLGCIWLKNKSYCILNKQYSQEEWHELAWKIFEQMEKGWILWEYFPWKTNPFYFNDTAASLIFNDLKKEEVVKEWFLWRDEKIKVDVPEWLQVIKAADLDVVNFDDSILKKVIIDENWNHFRIVAMELEFLQKNNLPLPRTHWLERIKLWFNF
ncbi:MAG: hypothetical protein ACD_3C00125G0002 [uncultured bacterium (gcode 4)]|uniref:Uncharacterized protein n=1 Tax=uncultured bacterium (gcode 4) TaxID=1234023 RepID=K2FY89_9BACT|nr:MAG: hypothetical protein ACD_3C00125G0002 [uncultured bacterium (gcode 4)]